MPKTKTSKKQGFSFNDMPELELKDKTKLSTHKAAARMKDRHYVSKALWQCLVENDVDAFKEILRTHLDLTNKEEFARSAGIPQRTLFRMLSPDGNPTLENVSKIISKLCA